MEWKISTLSEYLENYSRNTSREFMNTCRNLDGRVKGIANGTHIKIPTDVGYVNFYKSANSYEITAWMKLEIQRKSQELQEQLNQTKSEEL